MFGVSFYASLKGADVAEKVKVLLGVYVDRRAAREVRALARRIGTTVSGLLRAALVQMLATDRTEKEDKNAT